MRWKDGTSKDQVKIKLEVDVDLEVIGYEEGNGKFAGSVGAVVCATVDRGLVVSVSGFSDGVRSMINMARDSFLGKIMAVRANDVMCPSASNPLHSLFLPRYVEVRTDKTEADSTQSVLDQFNAAKLGKTLKKAA
jgi:DNA ligase-1